MTPKAETPEPTEGHNGRPPPVRPAAPPESEPTPAQRINLFVTAIRRRSATQ